MSDEIKNAISNYLQWEWNPEFRAEAEKLRDHGSNDLRSLFCKRLAFGTAGLRAAMGPGFSAMNDLVVLQTSQGLAQHLLSRHTMSEAKSRGIVIGFDGRHNSRRFANVAAAAFLAAGFKVYLGARVTATPICPFSVVHYDALCGVQVTASHNPKIDNGYKVYGENGAQITPPRDTEIATSIQRHLRPDPAALGLLSEETGLLQDSRSVVDDYDRIFALYMTEVSNDINQGGLSDCNIDVVYTAMHGVGFTFVKEILLNKLNFAREKFHVVEQQRDPDPEFSTVAFPNPEEKCALKLAQELADKNDAEMVIANDPDADRFAAAEKVGGKWHQFSGDEIGILFGATRLRNLKLQKVFPNKIAFLASAVSSRMLEAMAKKEGALFEDTMTGFKWMMNRALQLQGEGMQIGLVYEEALGYAMSMKVPDKDGISACAVWMQMANELKKEGKSVYEYLIELRKTYGYFVNNNGYYICHESAKIKQLFDEFRDGKNYRKFVTAPNGEQFEIARIRDVTTGYDSGAPNEKCSFLKTPDSQMISLFFKNGAVLTLRTSGTEPKLKWYSELGGADPVEAKRILDNVVAACENDICRLSEFPLIK